MKGGDEVILNYKEAMKYYGNDYVLKQEILSGNIFKIEKGIYSDKLAPDELAILGKKYDNFIITLQSALLYYGLSDYIPDLPTIITVENSFHISKKLCKQYYTNKKYYNIGVDIIYIDNTSLKIFNKERLLIEVIRYETKISGEEYNHILRKYRNMNKNLDFGKIFNYAENFKEFNKIYNVIKNTIL